MAMEKIYYTIGDVAATLGENVSLVRYWSNTFAKYIHPYKNAKGDRLFHEEDIETLKQIHYLVKDKGLTLKGAEQQLGADRRSIEARVKALDSLKSIRAQLVEVKNSL